MRFNGIWEVNVGLKDILLKRVRLFMETEKVSFLLLLFSNSSLFLSLSSKIPDAFENEMAKKVKLQNVLSQLRKCVDHPYLFDGTAVLLLLLYVNISVASMRAEFFKRIACIYCLFSLHFINIFMLMLSNISIIYKFLQLSPIISLMATFFFLKFKIQS